MSSTNTKGSALQREAAYRSHRRLREAYRYVGIHMGIVVVPVPKPRRESQLGRLGCAVCHVQLKKGARQKKQKSWIHASFRGLQAHVQDPAASFRPISIRENDHCESGTSSPPSLLLGRSLLQIRRLWSHCMPRRCNYSRHGRLPIACHVYNHIVSRTGHHAPSTHPSFPHRTAHHSTPARVRITHR